MSLHLNSQELSELTDEIWKDKDSIERVKAFLEEKKVDPDFKLHKKSKSAREAARRIGSDLKEIVKSLVFTGEQDLLVLVQGDRSVSEEKLKKEIEDSSLRLARPDEVKKITGYRVGTVSPFDVDIKVIIDKPIMELDVARPAAGSTCLGTEIDPRELKKITQGEVLKVS